jgi:hypothetical protein
MDAVMKVLKELERQAQAEAERRNQAFQQAEAAKKPPPQGQKPKGKKQKKQGQQPAPKLQVADDKLTEVEAIPTSAGAQVSTDARASTWNRQRVLDALTLTIALGPPPGLSDDDW